MLRNLILVVCLLVGAEMVLSCAANSHLPNEGLQQRHRRRASVGRVPCPAAEMVITPGSTNYMGAQDWTVSCRGRRFFCSQVNQREIFGPSHLEYRCIEE